MKLRPYQQDALTALHLARDEHTQRPLIAHATGLGKTILFAKFLRDLRREPMGNHRALIIAHRDELIRQAVDKLAMVDPKQETGVVKAEDNDTDAPCVVASIQTLARSTRFAKLMQSGRFDTVVCDEAHHSEADTYRRVFTDLGCFEPGGPLLLGVTATPFRGDKRALGETWQKIVHHVSILEGIKQGYLANLKAIQVRVQADFREIRSTHGELRDDDSERVMLEAQAPETIARAIKEYATGRPTLVFTPTVRFSEAVQAACEVLGINARHLDGTTEQETRREILRDFHTGQIDVLTNCGVLTEGYDEERISCIVMARPTKSAVFYTQCIGRGTRLHPDKPDCLIIDVVGVTHRHDLVTAPVLLQQAEAEQAEEQREEPKQLDLMPPDLPTADPNAELHAEPVDLFAQHPFAWVKTDFGYVLDVRQRTLLLRESDKGWRVEEHFGITTNQLFEGPSLGYAQGVAEDWIRELGLDVLAKKSASWRDDLMTEGQRRALEKWRVPFANTWSKGEAADALTRVIAQARLKTLHRQSNHHVW